MSPHEFFGNNDTAIEIFEAIMRCMAKLGQPKVKVMKSQISLIRNKTFARLWVPGAYLKGEQAPLVLTFTFSEPVRSARWKEVVEAKPGYLTHHLELRSRAEVDAQVAGWLRKAWDAA